MNAHDLLDRRAERGVPRGAANVWAGAQLTSPATHARGTRGSTTLFRVAVLAWILSLVAVGMVWPSSTDKSDTASENVAQDDGEPIQSDEPLPAPLLIDGGTLKRDHGGVSRPFDPDFDGDDIFDSIFPNTQPPEWPNDPPELPPTTIIFANPSEPFRGPILGVELLDGGGFRPWGANIANVDLSDLTQHLEQVNGDWSMAEDSGLVEVARFRDDHENFLKFGWQFDFQLAGNDEITIQAETGDDDHVVNEWIWIARLAGQQRSDTTVRPVQVLGLDGFVVDTDDRSGDDGVVWFSEGFIYRMTATRLEDNTSFGRDSTEDIDRLRVVDRSEWVDAIDISVRTSTEEWIVGLLGLLVLLAVMSSTILFLVKRSFQAAALAASVLIAWLFLSTSATYFGTAALTLLGLGLSWWLHHRSTRDLAK